MCLIAWKLPMARPNWNARLRIVDRELQAPAGAAGAVRPPAPPTAPVQARDLLTAGQASPGPAISAPGASSKVIRAMRWVWSKVGRGETQNTRRLGIDLEEGQKSRRTGLRRGERRRFWPCST